MGKALRIGASSLTCLLVLALDAPAWARPNEGVSAEETTTAAQARMRETNRSLLAALLARRAEVERSSDTPETKRAILANLDRRIAAVRSVID